MKNSTEHRSGGGNTNPRHRNYCFTSYIGKIPFSDDMKYLIQGEETCPTTGRKHIQGFTIFKYAKQINVVIKIGKGIHWEVCKGSIEENIKYCKKENNYTEEGEAPKGQGHRSDIKSIVTMISEGCSNREILNEHGDKALRIYRGIEWARKEIAPSKRRNWEMDVRIYYGKPGTGKTRAAWDEFGESLYPKMKGKWWDRYNGEETVLIDDFDPNNCFNLEYDFYLKLLDRYPMIVENKGGSIEFTSKRIIITSNFNPNGWWECKENRDAFFRRIKEIREFT